MDSRGKGLLSLFQTSFSKNPLLAKALITCSNWELTLLSQSTVYRRASLAQGYRSVHEPQQGRSRWLEARQGGWKGDRAPAVLQWAASPTACSGCPCHPLLRGLQLVHV